MKPDLEKLFIFNSQRPNALGLTIFAETNSGQLTPAEIGAIMAFVDGLNQYDKFGGDRSKIVEGGITRILDASRTVEEGKKKK